MDASGLFGSRSPLDAEQEVGRDQDRLEGELDPASNRSPVLVGDSNSLASRSTSSGLTGRRYARVANVG